ncbi:MAG: hypothetical protein OXU51_04975 [Candidatus Poribacteria bacterium]|nr:hypothetical protein [Candidatus Poribacteria bacterium]
MRMQVFSILLILICGVMGCAMLQEVPLIEIPASRLTCDGIPEIVDGDLKTVGTFTARGSIKKEFVTRKANRVYQPQQYQRRVEGTLKTETLIKLDVPTYIAYVEVYPASTIRNLILDAAVKPPNRKLSFEAVEDKRGIKVEGTLPVRFKVEREIQHLRLTANALEDPENVRHDDEERKMWIPLKGAAIREVKFYGRE